MDIKDYGNLVTKSNIKWVRYKDFFFDFINEDEHSTKIEPVHDFIEGIALDNNTHIYMYDLQAFTFPERIAHFHTDMYIMGKPLLDYRCNGLRFTGGVLGLVFVPNKLTFNLENAGYNASIKDDAMHWNFEARGKSFDMMITSAISESYGPSGNALTNNIVVLEITARDGIALEEVIPLYNAVHRMCQFLTFRKNISFEKVELIREIKINNMHFQEEFAELHSENHFRSHTSKEWIGCIPLGVVGDGIKILFKSIYEEVEKKPFFQLDFLPEDDDDMFWISPAKMKSICTCLECEAGLQKVTIKTDNNYKNFIKSVKDIISQHEQSTNPFPKKTYDLIRGDVEHWDLAAGDKIKMLFHKFEDIVILSDCFYDSIEDFEDAIDRFVKYRNTTTHGNFMKIEGKHADTAINLMNLIYISRLNRLGMEDKVIKALIGRGIVYR